MGCPSHAVALVTMGRSRREGLRAHTHPVRIIHGIRCGAVMGAGPPPCSVGPGPWIGLGVPSPISLGSKCGIERSPTASSVTTSPSGMVQACQDRQAPHLGQHNTDKGRTRPCGQAELLWGLRTSRTYGTARSIAEPPLAELEEALAGKMDACLGYMILGITDITIPTVVSIAVRRK